MQQGDNAGAQLEDRCHPVMGSTETGTLMESLPGSIVSIKVQI